MVERGGLEPPMAQCRWVYSPLPYQLDYRSLMVESEGIEPIRRHPTYSDGQQIYSLPWGTLSTDWQGQQESNPHQRIWNPPFYQLNYGPVWRRR